MHATVDSPGFLASSGRPVLELAQESNGNLFQWYDIGNCNELEHEFKYNENYNEFEIAKNLNTEHHSNQYREVLQSHRHFR